MRNPMSLQINRGGHPMGVSLLQDLISYWKMDEAAASAREDSVADNDLAVTGTVAETSPGLIVDAAGYSGPINNYLSVASNAGLQTGDIDFSIQLWLKPDPITDTVVVMAKGFTAGQLEYRITITSGAAILFGVSSDGNAYGGTLTSDATLNASAWNHVIVYHDSVNNLLGVIVNGVSKTSSYSAGVLAGVGPIRIGSLINGDEVPFSADEVGFWKRMLTTLNVTALYNSGAGKAFGTF